MSQNSRSPLVASLCLFSLLGALIFLAQASSLSEPEPVNLAADGFLAGVECQADEVLAAGKLPECEPTCENPKPACLKMFYTSLDFYPCFCRSPLVRDTKSKKCVELSDCPNNKKKN